MVNGSDVSKCSTVVEETSIPPVLPNLNVVILFGTSMTSNNSSNSNANLDTGYEAFSYNYLIAHGVEPRLADLMAKGATKTAMQIHAADGELSQPNAYGATAVLDWEVRSAILQSGNEVSAKALEVQVRLLAKPYQSVTFLCKRSGLDNAQELNDLFIDAGLQTMSTHTTMRPIVEKVFIPTAAGAPYCKKVGKYYAWKPSVLRLLPGARDE